MPRQVKILILAAIALIILGGVLFVAQPKGQEAMEHQAVGNDTLQLVLDPVNYDFGTISMKDGLVTKSFKVRNDQTGEIDLATIYTSCMCTTAKIVIAGQEYGEFGMQGHGTMKMLSQKLAAGTEAQLLVTFDPNAHGPSGIGVIERSVTLESKDGKAVSINIKANVTP